MDDTNIDELLLLKERGLVTIPQFEDIVVKTYKELLERHYEVIPAMEKKTGVKSDKILQEWSKNLLNPSGPGPTPSDEFYPNVFRRIKNYIDTFGLGVIEHVVSETFVNYMLSDKMFSNTYNGVDRCRDLQDITKIPFTEDHIQKAYQRLFSTFNRYTVQRSVRLVKKIKEKTKVKAKIPNGELLELAKEFPSQVMELIAAKTLSYNGRIGVKGIERQLSSTKKAEFHVWLHEHTDKKFYVSEEDAQREYEWILCSSLNNVGFNSFGNGKELRDTEERLNAVYAKTNVKLHDTPQARQLTEKIYKALYCSRWPHVVRKGERDLKRVGLIKKLEEIGAIPISEKVVQEAYRYHLSDEYRNFGHVKELEEISKIKPSTEVIKVAYKENLRQLQIKTIEELFFYSGIKPDYTSADLKKAYDSLLAQRKISEIALLERITDIPFTLV